MTDAQFLTDHAEVLLGLGVLVVVLARLYAGEQYFDDRSRFWGPLRRVFIPLVHRIARHTLGEGAYAAYEIGEEEHVVTLAVDYQAVLNDLADAGYQPHPLAALKTDWEGRTEVASWARYYGPRPFPGAPEFLRQRQVHVTLFYDAFLGETIVTGHEEATSWRPDLALDHYRGATQDVDLGRELIAADLGVEARPVSEAPATSDRRHA